MSEWYPRFLVPGGIIFLGIWYSGEILYSSVRFSWHTDTRDLCASAACDFACSARELDEMVWNYLYIVTIAKRDNR